MSIPANIDPSERAPALAGNPGLIEDYIFNTPFTLPEGNWMLTVEKGDAWIFTDKRNLVLNTNETMKIDPSDGEARIQRLYSKSVVRFQAAQII